MRFSVFGEEGELLATNEYFSVGGGFVVNNETEVGGENLFYKGVDKRDVSEARLRQVNSMGDAIDVHGDVGRETEVEGTGKEGEGKEHPYPFDTGATLLALTKKHNVCFPFLNVGRVAYAVLGVDDDCADRA